ncbi:MAG: InlB B-repeat-containing protein [Turicibacter sp.]|nr:InlB B-repeat-containing protein [Turicibacter sp.]
MNLSEIENEFAENLKLSWNELSVKPKFNTLSIGFDNLYLKKIVNDVSIPDFAKNIVKNVLKDLKSAKSSLSIISTFTGISKEKLNKTFDEIVKSSTIIEDNGAVHISSQAAVGFNNVNNVTIYFDESDYEDFNFAMPGFNYKTPYAGELNNSKVIGEIAHICDLLRYKDDLYNITIVNKSGYNYIYKLDEKLLEEEWHIPNIVRGKVISGICSNFTIEQDAVKKIFIPKEIQQIETDAFSGFTNLIEIEVDSENSSLVSDSEGVLYSKSFTDLIYYPIAKKEINYVVNKNATLILEGAIKGVEHLSSIDISNVEYVGKRAFLNSTNISEIIGGNNIKWVDLDAFTGTNFFNNNNNIVLGEMLVKFSEGVFPENIKYIASNAVNECNFSKLSLRNIISIGNSAFNNCTFERLVLGETLIKLGDYSFKDCQINGPLDFIGIQPPSMDCILSLDFNEVIDIRVPNVCLNEYKCLGLNETIYNIQPITVEISLNYESGDIVNTTVMYLDTINCLSNEDIKTGYNFIGWYDNNDIKYENGMLCDFYDTKALFAKWETKEFKIIYDLNEGSWISGQEIPLTFNIESDPICLPIPSKTGYHFIGWYSEDNDLITEINNGRCSDIKLEARWTARNYIINLHAMAEDVNFNQETLEVTFDESFMISHMPERVGYKFIGWFDQIEAGNMIANENGEGVYNIEITDLYAHWQIETYEIKIELQDSSFVWVVNSFVVSDKTTQIKMGEIIEFVNLIDTFKRAEQGFIQGYKFIKFNTQDGDDLRTIYGDSAKIEDINGESRIITIKAVWEKEVHSLRFNTQVKDKSFPDVVAEYGSKFVLPNDTDIENRGITVVGHHFAGWYTYNVNSNGEIQYLKKFNDGLMPDLTLPNDISNANERYNAQSNGTVTLIAKWEENSYYITFDTMGGNKINDMTILYGHYLVGLPTPIKTGNNFAGWHYDGYSVDSSTQFLYTHDIILYAEWEAIQYNIEYTNYEFCPNQKLTYTVNDSFVLPIPKKLGYRFIGWEDEKSQILEVIQKGTYGNKKLTAKWFANEVLIGTTSSVYNVTNDYSIFTVNGSVSFSIKSNVDQVMFTTNGTQRTVNINVENRNRDLTIIFKNVKFISKANSNLIEAPSSYKLNIISEGTNTLTGGNLSTSALSSVINCQEIVFYGQGTLSIIGANNVGHNGIHGMQGGYGISATGYVTNNMKELLVRGGRGSDGVKPNDAPDTTMVPAKQKNGKVGLQGYTGISGTNGGSGGSGGIGIYGATKIINNSRVIDCYLLDTNTSTKFSIYGGNGGNGGDGGKGGKGGQGGEGSDGVFLIFGKQGGDGGKGGQGGNGGAAGKGGLAVYHTGTYNNCITANGADGLLGYKGEGGEGGEGGRGGKKLNKNEYYPSGNKGAKGDDGAVGRDRN